VSGARLSDWQSRLGALFFDRAKTPFTWGANDCASFACDCVLAQTGHDPAEHLRGYADAASAAHVLKDGGGLRRLADKRLGAKIPPALAQVGDVGLTAIGGRPSLVVCGGERWYGPSDAGLVSIPAADVRAAWRAV
jgi:hypothetical protein